MYEATTADWQLFIASGILSPRNDFRLSARVEDSMGREISMRQAKKGDTVQVHYKGTLDDGSLFDSSTGREPLEVTLGAGEVIPGFEDALLGMSEGETRTTHILADEAYGPRSEDLVFHVDREQIEPGTEVELGDHLQIGFPDGQTASVEVTAMDEKTLTLDANHSLAGMNLTFELTLVSIG